jgi:outer membrane protein assembly factor BamB
MDAPFGGRIALSVPYTFDATNGNQLWELRLSDGFENSPPTAVGGTVYVSLEGPSRVYAINELDGSVTWESRMVEYGGGCSPAVTAGSVFVSYSGARTYAYERATGKDIWDRSFGGIGGGGKSPAYHRGRLYVRDRDFGVYNSVVLDAATGDEVGDFRAERPATLVGNLGLYFNYSTLSANELTTGEVYWRFTGDGYLITTPIVVNGVIYIGESGGTLWALNRMGRPVWSTWVGAELAAPDEQNASQPLTGLGAGEGLVVVPAVDLLVAYGN